MRYFYFIIITWCCFACDKTRVYEENIDINHKIWLADSILQFEFEIPDNNQSYNLYLNIRNTASYPYENIYLTYQLKNKSDTLLKKELVNYNLFDPKTGMPYGDGLGDVFDHQYLLLNSFNFNKSGTYLMELQQYMRRDSLPEILSAGIRVERLQQAE